MSKLHFTNPLQKIISPVLRDPSQTLLCKSLCCLPRNYFCLSKLIFQAYMQQVRVRKSTKSFDEQQGSEYNSFLVMVHIINKTFASCQRVWVHCPRTPLYYPHNAQACQSYMQVLFKNLSVSQVHPLHVQWGSAGHDLNHLHAMWGRSIGRAPCCHLSFTGT